MTITISHYGLENKQPKWLRKYVHVVQGFTICMNMKECMGVFYCMDKQNGGDAFFSWDKM